MKVESESYLYGIRCFIAGLGLIRQPGLRRFVLIPLLINMALIGVASWLLWVYLSSMVDALLPSWLAWLTWLILPLFMASVLTIVFYTFTLLANIIAAPFYGQLAKAVETRLQGGVFVEAEASSLFREIPKMMGSEVRKLFYYLLRAIPLLVLSLIPGLNVITLPLWLMFSAWFLAFEYTGYSFENHDILFDQQKQILKHSKVNTMSFGGVSLLATSIPIVNLFAPAIAVAGATKMLVERDDLT